MSKYTDELFDLCVNIVKTHNVSKLFINAGHSINARFFRDYLEGMCDIDNLYVIYEYNIYYKGKIVTKEVLNESYCNALVLPVYSSSSVSNLANIWNHILLNNKCKERVDVTLKCLTSRYVLIDQEIFNVDFLQYIHEIEVNLNYITISVLADLKYVSKLRGDNILIVSDKDKLAKVKDELDKAAESSVVEIV